MRRYLSDAEKLSNFINYRMKDIGKFQCIQKLEKYWGKSQTSVYRKISKEHVESMNIKELITLANVLEITPAELLEGGKEWTV